MQKWRLQALPVPEGGDRDRLAVFVTCDAEDDNFARLNYDGPDWGVRRVRQRLVGQVGAFGHWFDPSYSSPLDLQVVMAKPELVKEFQPELVEGDRYEIVPNIPEGAVT
ncbi:MAG: hypothetical protein J7642_21280 [Cyanobacteria bacterium SBC]|nr:hypothetical protein [Cyanobacteria bacterium SBC]